MKGFWRRLLAIFRIDLNAVCEESRGDADFHDYPDSIDGEPWHFATMTCKRCGKEFAI